MSHRIVSPLLAPALLLSLSASTLAGQTAINTGQISTVAGNFSGSRDQPIDLREGAPAVNSGIGRQTVLASDADGSFYFVVDGCSVAKVDTAGVLTRLAGQLRAPDGASDGCGFSGDGGPARAANLSTVYGLAVDSVAHKLYISDYQNYRLRAIDLTSGIIDTIIGTGAVHELDDAYLDDFSEIQPAALATDKDGNLFIFDQSHYRLLRRDASTGVVTRVAGKGSPYGFNEPAPHEYVVVGLGDGGDAKAAGIRANSIAVDQQGNLYLGDWKFIRRIAAATGIINTVAGYTWKTTDPTRPGPNYNQTGPALRLGLTNVDGIATSADGHVFFSDNRNYLIYRLDVAASHVDIVTRADFADNDDLSPKQVSIASVLAPEGVAFDAAGSLLIADRDHTVIRRVQNAANMHVGNVPVGTFTTAALAGGVAASGGVSLTFDSTTAAGDATLTTTAGGTPPLPTGIKLGTPSTYLNITSTATFTGTVLVCVNYSGTSYTDPSQLKLYHYDHTGAWVDITSNLYPESTMICGITDSFSPFAIVEPGSTAPPVDLAIRNVAPASAVSGNNLTYLLGVANLSTQAATGVTISDTLPLGVTFVSAYWGKASCSVSQGKLTNCSSSGKPASCSISGRTVTCATGSLNGFTALQPTGALAAVTVRVTAAKGATVSNTGTVTSTNPDSNAANNSSTVSTKISK